MTELAASAFAAVGWLDRWSAPAWPPDVIDTAAIVAEHGCDAEIYTPSWAAWPRDLDTGESYPLRLFGVLWPRDPRRLATARGRAWVRLVLACRERLGPMPPLHPAGRELAIRVVRVAQSLERLLESEARAAAAAASSRADDE